MSDVILKIGEVDMSEYVERSSFNVSASPVYSGNTFTNVYGKEIKEYLGERISISTSFSLVPEHILQSLKNACILDGVTIEYAAPDVQAAEFEHPSINCAMVMDDGDTTYWDVSLSAVCSLKSYGL